jgi:hypothetical protein
MPSDKPEISLPEHFRYGPVDLLAQTQARALEVASPSLGPLAAFVGSWSGTGFNTIFRPQNPASPTQLPHPRPDSDNILELNLTSEKLTFSPSLGSVPNRGAEQADIFLNGIPYLQAINDVTFPGQTIGIHVEPGLWMAVPETNVPKEGPTIFRMGSIPHGTTIEAQGTSLVVNGGPDIKPVDITPFTIAPPHNKITFDSQRATKQDTPRLPQDLSAYIADGRINQEILDDPNTVLRKAIQGLTITSTTVIVINTVPPPPLFGGGTDNIAFLQGDPQANKPNANAVQMSAIFWVETVEYKLQVPVFYPGQQPLLLEPAHPFGPHAVRPTFLVDPPKPIENPIEIKVKAQQIQYTQFVVLNFKGLGWPHVSVATLVPSDPIPVPASVWN